jgi:transcription elongation factor GreB
MSKAFTKDEGQASVDLVRRQAPPTVGGAKRNLTPEGRLALIEELARLTEERTALVKSPGVDAPQRLAEVESRITFVQSVLEATQVVTPDLTRTRIYFGAWVELEDQAGPARAIFRLVGPDEADPRLGRISTSSPLGQAILGKEEGDEVLVRRPRGAARYVVVTVSYQPLGQ